MGPIAPLTLDFDVESKGRTAKNARRKWQSDSSDASLS